MDTRTPSEPKTDWFLLKAGKLGITGKQNLIDFVEAANTIKVALGEDLGRGRDPEHRKTCQHV